MKKALIPWHEGYIRYHFGNHLFTSKKYALFKKKVTNSPYRKFLTELPHPIKWEYLKLALDPVHLQKLEEMSTTGTGMLDPSTPAFKDMLFPARLGA